MKKIILFVTFIACLTSYTNAQDTIYILRPVPVMEDTMKTVFRCKRPKAYEKKQYWGFYGEMNVQYGQFNDDFAYVSGGSFMFICNKRFAIGGTMQRIADQSFAPNFVNTASIPGVEYLHAGFGGLKMEYTVMPNSVIHLTVPLVLGYGWANVNGDQHIYSDSHYEDLPTTNSYYIVQPGLQAELNLFKFLKLFAGANYRFSMEADITNTFSSTTLQGFGAVGGIKAGIFDIPYHSHKYRRFR